MVERFTRFVWGGVSVGKEAGKVRAVMRSLMWSWPIRPYILRADNAFGEAREYQKLSDELGFTWKIGSAYHPESQGAGEALNKRAKERIKLETTGVDESVKLEESLPGAAARVDRICREAVGGLSSNELTYGMLVEVNQNACEGIILNQRPQYLGQRRTVDEALENVMYRMHTRERLKVIIMEIEKEKIHLGNAGGGLVEGAERISGRAT